MPDHATKIAERIVEEIFGDAVTTGSTEEEVFRIAFEVLNARKRHAVEDILPTITRIVESGNGMDNTLEHVEKNWAMDLSNISGSRKAWRSALSQASGDQEKSDGS